MYLYIDYIYILQFVNQDFAQLTKNNKSIFSKNLI